MKITKTKIIIFSLLLFSGIFLNIHSAQAFLDVPFDIMQTQLDALDFVDNSLLRYMVLLALLLVQGIVLLTVSANLLDWSSSLSISLSNNDLVNAGWNFTSGLVNISFILIFVIIALCYILRVETFGMKKALPRLIIVAFLINFSLLFVKMIVDLGWVVQSAFINVFFAKGFAATALQPLWDNIGAVYKLIAADLAWFVGFALIPGLNVAKTAILALWFFTAGGWDLISQAILLTVFSFAAGFVFLFYSLLFLFRIVIIWLLAILAPLAFACFIFPSTEKFFKQWLHTLVQWLLFGVVTFLFLGLGLSLFGIISGKAIMVSSATAGLHSWTVPNDLAKFIFLLVYLVATFMVAKKTAPIGADMMWNLSSMAVNKAGKWSSGAMKKYGPAFKVTPAYVPRAEMAMRRWGEKLPVVGRMFGGPGALDVELDRERKKAGKDLESMAPPNIRRIAQMRAFTKEARLKRARAIELLAEKNELEEQDRVYVPETLRFGVGRGTIYNKMPHWSMNEAGVSNISERVEKMDVGEFRTNIRPQAFEAQPNVHTNENLDVFYAMDMTKVQGLGRMGKRAQKEALWRLTGARAADINAEIIRLRASGNPDNARQADKIENMWLEIQNSPNYTT